MPQTNSPAGLHEVLATNAAKIRIMENQITELGTLLNEIDVRKALDLVVKAVKTNELAQHNSRIVETERLIEIAGEQKVVWHIHPSAGAAATSGIHQANQCDKLRLNETR